MGTVKDLIRLLQLIENQNARVEFSVDYGGETLISKTQIEIINRSDDGYIELVSELDDSEAIQLTKDCENLGILYW